ncbi:hypothetical protein LCGC14_1557510 [marine sediment metagenome]|uniref:Uncharacterized protein n=1 Tax=marine sediment metagenome TaxID=412755 RepID=A0A0F9INK9_9ZZZZ
MAEKPVNNAVQDPTPTHDNAFGAANDADATRQAQHAFANDTPVDVNPNAVIARAQVETITMMGKSFEANAARREAMFGIIAAKIAAAVGAAE